MDLADYVDDTATLFGLAENAAAGAILRCGPNTHVYIGGLPRWADDELDAAFEVTGHLVAEGDDADLRASDGRPRHGLGRHYVLKDATWERIT
ncbi:hypothetical protein [Nocardia sp. NPDC050710]|uniref:hypothetical protein n=1 Tax=Nocardia sp. NPDC050710 TaxID=3157220 RepID=UPI003411D023